MPAISCVCVCTYIRVCVLYACYAHICVRRILYMEVDCILRMAWLVGVAVYTWPYTSSAIMRLFTKPRGVYIYPAVPQSRPQPFRMCVLVHDHVHVRGSVTV